MPPTSVRHQVPPKTSWWLELNWTAFTARQQVEQQRMRRSKTALMPYGYQGETDRPSGSSSTGRVEDA